MSGTGHKYSASSSQNHKAALANAYNELGKELASTKVRVVGNYTLGKVIGEGTYGKVRLGTHRLTQTRVAIKQIPKAMSAALTREIHHHRRLHHPHICQLYEVIATESNIWLVTELCSGGELFDYLAEKGRLSEDESRIIFGQLCLAVGYIHDRGVVHRDLKLENVLLDERCRVKLGDFGFTREYERGNLLETYCGTTGYAAPEMLMAKKYLGAEVDIWSLGVILYCLMTGTLPFDDDDDARMREKIIIGHFEVPEWLSEDAQDLIKGILQYDPTKRLSIAGILAHPWFNVSKSMGDPDIPEEETIDEPFVLPPKPKPPSPSTSSSSFHSASSEFSPSMPATPDDSLIQRNNSESTLKKLPTTSEDLEQNVRRRSSKRRHAKPEPVLEEREMSPTRAPNRPVAPSLFPTRTPARTKRRSVSSILSQPSSPTSEGPVLPLPLQDYAALLMKPAPLLFSTPLERNILNNLSSIGFDIGQMVHSVLSDACDSSGAMWWMLKRKAEKKSLEAQLKKTASRANQLELETEAETELDISSPSPAAVFDQLQLQTSPIISTNVLEASLSAPELAFVPPTPTITDTRHSNSPSPPVTPPRSKSPRSLLSPTPTSMDSIAKSSPSTPSGRSDGSKGKNNSKPRSGSVSIMQRATTALEAAGLVRKKSTEAVRDDKEKKDDKRPSSSLDSRSGHGHGSGSSHSHARLLQKSPPPRSTKDSPLPSTPEREVAAESDLASPWVIPIPRSSTFSAPISPSNTQGDVLSPLPDSQSTGKLGTARNRGSILTQFRMWFNDDRKGKRKGSASSSTPTTMPSTNPSSPNANRNRGTVKRRGTWNRPRAAKRASISSRRSSSVNSRRSSVASASQLMVLDPSPYNGGEQAGNISRQRSDPSRRSFTPNSEADRPDYPSRPSSVHSYRANKRHHRKSPSTGSSGSVARLPGNASPMQKYHRRAGSGSSTRVVRQTRPTPSTAPTRPGHVRSNSTTSSIHSLQSSRRNSFYDASESEGQRTGSPLPVRSSEDTPKRGSFSTVLIAHKKQTPLHGPSNSMLNSSMRGLGWKKAWGTEPPGWQSRATQAPVEVLAIFPATDPASTIRDVFTGRQSMSFGDESDWVDEEEEITIFAPGFGQSTGASSSKMSMDPPMTLSPPPRGNNRGNKAQPRSLGPPSRTQAGRSGGRSKPGHSPIHASTPLPGGDNVFDGPSEPLPQASEPRMNWRQLPAGRPGSAFRTPIQEEDEGEE